MRKRSAAPAASDTTSPIMGGKVLLAAVCFLTLSKLPADAKIPTIKLDDSVGEATVPQLYRNIPDGVYASTSPYAAFSFQIPSFLSSPRLTHISPIKQASTIVEKRHGFLKDSYGNKFVGSPQTSAYRTAFPQQYVQLQELPAHLAQPLVSAAPSYQYRQVTPHFFGPPQFKVQALQAASPSTSNRYAINEPYSFSGFRTLEPSQQYQYPASNIANYGNSRATEQKQNQKNVEKPQRLEEIPNSQNKDVNKPAPKATQNGNAQVKAIAASASVNKGKKAALSLATKPPVPLLDLTLLEPLTFDNPLVPQVQHFLPRIASVTYQKLPELNVKEIKKEMKQFMIQNTKSYDSGVVKGKPKIYVQKVEKEIISRPRKEKEETTDENDPPRDVPNGEPEILYEIKSPNYKETYQEKVLSYNKETETEPVHYSYNEKTEKKPVVYNYVRTSKEPLKVQNVNNDGKDQNPEHLIYKFKPEEVIEHKNAEPKHHSPQQTELENSSEDSDEGTVRSHQKQNHDQAPEKETPHRHEKLEHREEEYQDNDEIAHLNNHYGSPQESIQVKNAPAENPDIEPVITEYEEDIRILPTPKQYATIKVDPTQHIQHGHGHGNSREPQDRRHGSQDESPDDSPEDSPQDTPHNQQQSDERPYRPSEEHVHEKSKSIIIKEEIPEDGAQNNQELKEERPENDDKSEEHFEKAYKNAAYGFPSYESTSRDTEKEIYNPETYGKSQYHSDFDVEHVPFQQYQVEGDDYPKSTRSNYKDARDKTKENYYLDYAVSKPKSIEGRFRQKENYYKSYMKQKPHYLKNEGDEKESAKYIAAPAYDYHGSAQKPKQYFAKYQAAPTKVFEYDYSKEAPKDNSAHATRPLQRFKTYTQFVEPQFQYGFEPSGLPRLLDSELAAMASNHSPKNEKPGMRKKMYKENWYIKETSTNGRKAAS